MSSNAMISLRPGGVIRQLPWQLDRNAALGLILLLVVFGLVGWLYLSQASAVTTTSYQIDELRLELEQLKNENAALTLEIARLEALPRVEARARELGFQPTRNVRYLRVPNYPVASEEETLPGRDGYLDLSPAETVAVDPSPWWIDILDKVATWFEGL